MQAELHLPAFDGPLELLLHLIERNDLDITAISLVAVTDQYLAAIRTDDGFDPGALAEFVAIGAKLIYLKSRALLPRPPIDPALDEEEDVGQELIDLLNEYRRIATVTDILQERQDQGRRHHTRMAMAPLLPEGPGLDGVTVDLMRKIMLDVMRRRPSEPRAVLPRHRSTLAQQIAVLRDHLHRNGRFSFREAISECVTRLDIVLSFLAVLELLKGGECDARQDVLWGDIEVVATVPAAAAG
ncbi:MAG: segregation/condensation protein A [Dehalococcoidia bacterium]|nr:segregation/condensation protein A [Dehalococcoidia bacterium]